MKFKGTQKFFLVGVIFVTLIFVVEAVAQNDSMFSYSIANEKGKQTLRIEATSPEAGRVLGVTFYPTEVKGIPNDAFSRFFAVKKGIDIVEIPVDSRYVTFEAALWTKAIPKSECLKTDSVCQKVGFRAGGYSTSYMWGYLYAPIPTSD